MRRILLAVFLTLPFLLSNQAKAQEWVRKMQDPEVNFYEVQKSFYEYWDGKEVTKGNGWKQFKRWEYFMAPRVNDSGYIPRPAITWQSYNASIAKQNGIKNADPADWRHLGPVDVPTHGGAGRLNCIAFHPTNADIMHVGAPSGGLWTTNNGTASWSTNTDDLAAIGITDIVVDHSNPDIVYAATGDADAADTYSIGVIKSTDGGNTWNATDLAFVVQNNIRLRRLIMHPANSQILYVAANNGLYKTTDGGDNWNRIRPGFYYDVAFKPGNPNTLYLATPSNILISTQAGQNFQVVTSLNFSFNPGRIAIGVTPADTNYIYILASNDNDNSYGGIYLSTDGGTTFTEKSTSPNIFGWSSDGSGGGGQAWYDMAITVSPLDPDLVVVGGINIWRSFNGGANWALSGHWRGDGAPYVHADIHGLKFYPNSTKIYASTDGGLFVSQNNGQSWADHSDGLAIAQMYRLGASTQSKYKILTGWQDNGTNLKTNVWTKMLGGDGMEAIVDYSDDQVMYASYYYGRIYRTTNSGYDWNNITDNVPGDGAWVTPYLQDHNDPNTLYLAYEDVYKSINRGDTWTKISNFGGYNMRALAVAPSNSDYIYTATYNNLYRTKDGGANWTNIVGNIPNTITYIAIDPNNPERVFVTTSNYTSGEKVYMSEDAGDNWTNISGNLPNLPANCIVYERNSPDGLYVGMDVGVYYRDTMLGDWIQYSQNLPNVIVNELQINYQHNLLRAATYGRGLWESHLYSVVGVDEELKPEKKLKVYPNPVSDVLKVEMPQSSAAYTIQAFNVNGELVLEKQVGNLPQANINVSALTRGVYHIRVVNNKQVWSASFIKIK